MEIHSSQWRICAYLPRLSSIRIIITHIKMPYCPQKTWRTFIDISPTLPIWKRSCQPFKSYRRVRGLVYLRLGGRLSSDPSLHILVVTTPDQHPTHLPNTYRTSSKRPPLESKALSSQETHLFHRKFPNPRPTTFYWTKSLCTGKRGWKRAWQEFARLLRLLPRSAPKSAASGSGTLPLPPAEEPQL